MEWTDVKDSLKSLYDESCEVWDGKKDGSSFDAGHRFITESINILDGFFSDKADQIHGIYTAIKENAYPFNRVEVIDLPVAYSKYMDYYPGMLEFCEATASLTDNDDIVVESAASTVDTVIGRDKKFVDSIFFMESYDSMNLNDAMKNVEMISDLVAFEEKLKTDIDAMKASFDSFSAKYNDVKESGVSMYMQSVASFLMDMIMKIVYTYHQIVVSMQDRAGSDFIPKKETPEYQIF